MSGTTLQISDHQDRRNIMPSRTPYDSRVSKHHAICSQLHSPATPARHNYFSMMRRRISTLRSRISSIKLNAWYSCAPDRSSILRMCSGASQMRDLFLLSFIWPYFCFVSGNSLIDLVIIHDITLSTKDAPGGVRRHSAVQPLMFSGFSGLADARRHHSIEQLPDQVERVSHHRACLLGKIRVQNGARDTIGH